MLAKQVATQIFDDDAQFLRIDRLSKSFAATVAVDSVSLSIRRGEIFALLGASGCGKSTLLRLLAGFEVPSAGSIYLEGQDIAALPPYARPINMMFQSYALFPHLNVWDNIAFGLRRDRIPARDIVERVEAMLALTQLTGFGQRQPHQLSGGQQQRVALARSLAKRPKLLLLDEPLGALDKKLREQTQLELVSIIKQVGVSCVLVTHDQDEAMTMADRIAVMHKGGFAQVDAPQVVYETPANRYVADFIGNVNLFEGRVVEDADDHVVIEGPEGPHYISHGITGTVGMVVSVAVRPEKISMQSQPPSPAQREAAGEDGYNAVRCVITNRSYLGSYTLFYATTASGKTIKIMQTNVARHEQMQLGVGDAATAWWDGSDVVVLTQ